MKEIKHYYTIDPRQEEPYEFVLHLSLTESEREHNLSFIDSDLAMLDLLTQFTDLLLKKINKGE